MGIVLETRLASLYKRLPYHLIGTLLSILLFLLPLATPNL